MIDELRKLRELTETLTGNGYLRDQAEEWEYALDAIPDLIYIINIRGEIKFVNKALATRVGLTADECVDKMHYILINGFAVLDFPGVWKDKDTIEATPYLEEQYIDKLQGWFNISRAPIYTKVGKFIGFICVMQEITLEKNARDEMRRKEETLETVFNAAPIGIGLLERYTRIIKAVNKTILDITGYKEEELVGRSCRILYPSDEEFARVGGQKKEDPGEFEYGFTETLWKTKVGSLRNIFLKSSRVGSNGSIVFTATDVTETKHTEQHVNLFVANTPLAVIGWDVNFVITSWNDAAVKIFGYSKKEAIGKKVDIIIPPSETEYVHSKWKLLVDRVGGKRGTNKNITKKGKIIICDWYNTPLIGADETTVGVVSLGMDITNLIEREISIRLNEERLASSLKLATMDSLDENFVMDYTLEEAVRLTESKIGYLHFVNNTTGDLSDTSLNLFKWSRGVAAHCKMSQTTHYMLSEAGCWADCVRTKLPAVHNDYEHMTIKEGRKGLPSGHIAINRHMSVPILEDGEVVAIAGVGNKEQPYEESDVNQLSLFMNTMWDILKRKRISHALQESEGKFEKLFDISPEPTALVNLDTGKFVNVNDRFEVLFGCPKIEIIGQDSVKLGFWKHTFDINKFYEMINDSGKVQNMVFKLSPKDSEEVRTGLLSATIVQVFGRDHLLAVIKDVTGIFKNEDTNT